MTVEAAHDEDGRTKMSVDSFMNVFFAKISFLIRITLTYLKDQDNFESSCSTRINF